MTRVSYYNTCHSIVYWKSSFMFHVKQTMFVTIQDVQNNRPQVYALLRSVLNESHGDSAPRAFAASV